MSRAGILRVDKPEGPTSHDVVNRVRHALGERRVGHTGTLDPFATGLLLVCVGRTATRLAPLLTDLPKTYRAVARLGEETTTDDLTGDVTLRVPLDDLEPERVRSALEAMAGESMQTPPAYSAKKVEGRRAYRSAREGVEVQLRPVRVVLHRVEVLEVRIPDVEFEVECSSGTYIRAIARDLGRDLGVGGHLRALRRTAIGSHSVDGAIPLEELTDPGAVREAWLEPLDALPDLPRVHLDGDDAARIGHGMSVERPASAPDTGQVALVHEGVLLAIGVAQDGAILPKKVFA